MYRVILAATDGSGSGTHAMEMAADIAAKYGARLVLLSVVSHGPLPEELTHYGRKDLSKSPHPLLAHVPSWFDDARDAVSREPGELHALVEDLARVALDHGAELARAAGVAQYETMIEHGVPSEKILACAERENADLIVMGRRGLGSFSELFLGSTTYKVMQLTEKNCLTVR